MADGIPLYGQGVGKSAIVGRGGRDMLIYADMLNIHFEEWKKVQYRYDLEGFGFNNSHFGVVGAEIC